MLRQQTIEMKNLNAKLMETLKECDWFRSSESLILARMLFFLLKTHTVFSLQNNGIDKQYSLCFDQSFGMFCMCNVDLSTSPQPMESGLIQETSLCFITTSYLTQNVWEFKTTNTRFLLLNNFSQSLVWHACRPALPSERAVPLPSSSYFFLLSLDTMLPTQTFG